MQRALVSTVYTCAKAFTDVTLSFFIKDADVLLTTFTFLSLFKVNAVAATMQHNKQITIAARKLLPYFARFDILFFISSHPLSSPILKLNESLHGYADKYRTGKYYLPWHR